MPDTLVKLTPPKRASVRSDDRFHFFVYRQSAPFFHNPRGVLIHRVKSLYRITYSDRSWFIVDYWCDNVGRADDIDDALHFDPGKKLVCARCEAMAVAKGEKTSSDLAGRHVCTGVCRPVNTCCPNDQN